MLKAINIKWDTDGDKNVFNELPTEMILPDELEEMYKKDKEYALEEISDWLSEETGFCDSRKKAPQFFQVSPVPGSPVYFY